MLTDAEIDFNRRSVIHRLTTNPARHNQITGKLTDGNNGYCAIGEMGEALHISPKLNTDGLVYSKVAEMVGENRVTFIHISNDSGRTFTQIAKELAERWNLN